MTAYLVKSGGKQVQGSQDATIGAQTVLFHHIFVVHLSMETVVVCYMSDAATP